MLEVVPTVVINSAVDWPAVVAGISAGVAALAGIGGTIWVATRGWSREEKRARIAEKRKIYANCLTALSTGFSASIHREAFRDLPEGVQAAHEFDLTVLTAVNAVSELTLIAPDNVARIAGVALVTLYNATGYNRNLYTETLDDLTKAMRVDLGEPPLAGRVAPLVAHLPSTLTAPDPEGFWE